MAKPTYTLQELLELAVAACDLNSFSKSAKYGYVKSSYPLTGIDYDTGKLVTEPSPEDYNGVYQSEAYVFANRDLIKETLGVGSLNRFKPDLNSIPKLVVNDEHRAQAEKIHKHFKGLSFKAMADKMNDFEKAVFKVITTEELTSRDVGLVASLPSSYNHEMKRKGDLKAKKELAKNSSYIGSVGDRLETELQIVTHKFLPRFDCYVVNAIANDKDMVAFFTGKDAAVFGKKCKVRGTVKRTDISKYNNGPETFLTRVMVKEVIS